MGRIWEYWCLSFESALLNLYRILLSVTIGFLVLPVLFLFFIYSLLYLADKPQLTI